MSEDYWQPKTPAAERAVPFEFDDRVENIVAAFFEFYREVPFSVNTARRRVKHAYRGLNVPALQAMMGWAKIETAEKYIRLSGGRTKQALNEVFSTV